MQRQALSSNQVQSIAYVDEKGGQFLSTDPGRENTEQFIASGFIKSSDCILELGGRYGTVSCIANHILDNPFNHVVVEPDNRVVHSLNMNRALHNYYFFIFDGIISKGTKYSLTKLNDCNGYGTTSVQDAKSQIPIMSLDQLQQVVFKPFTCLIADCEGYLETFLDENPSVLETFRLITFEKDGNCDYEKIKTNLLKHGFKLLCEFNKSHFVYEKQSI